MHVLAFIAPTDPIGKAALALGLISSARRTGCGPVALIAAAPGREPILRANARLDEGVTLLASEPYQVPAHLERLRQEGFAVAAIDTPASPPRDMEVALAQANLVIIPVAPSKDGLRSVATTVDLVDQCRKPFVFVINGAAPGEEIDPAVAMALVQHGPLSPIVVPRQDESSRSPSNAAIGRGEEQRDSNGAMAQLWKYIEERLKKVSNPLQAKSMISDLLRERRRFHRWELAWQATLIRGSERRECTVADISGGGIAIRIAQPPPEGESVTIETPVLGPIAALVVHVSGEKVGLKFLMDAAEKWRLAERLADLVRKDRQETASDASEASEGEFGATGADTAPPVPDHSAADGVVETMIEPAASSYSNVDSQSRFHPLALLFPAMGADELAELAEDIKIHGLRDPIVVMPEPDGRILDGRHRYLACERAGVAPRFRPFDGADPVAFVISANLRRRHLKESQRAMVAAKLANLDQGRPPRTAQDYAVSQAQAAAMLGVSRRSVQSAKVIHDRGAAELIEAVEQGRVSVNTASKIAKRPLEEQGDLAKAGAHRMREALKQAPSRELPLPQQRPADDPSAFMVVGDAASSPDDQHRLDAITDPAGLRTDWFALKVPLWHWQFEAMTLTPEEAVAAVPPQERANVLQRLATITDWLERVAALLRRIEQGEAEHPPHETAASSVD